MKPVRWHRPAWDYEGYGTYEFSDPLRGYGQLPAGISIDDVISNMDAYIIDVGGIQVARTEVQQPIMDTLDQFDFVADGPEEGTTISGTASFSPLTLFGSDFASDYRGKGFAVMADKTSVAGGSVRVLLTQVAGVIADNASQGKSYVVISAPDELLVAAQAALQQRVPPKPDPGAPPPRPLPTVPPGCYLDMDEHVVCPPAQAGVSTPGWVVPAVIGVGALAVIAMATVIGK